MNEPCPVTAVAGQAGVCVPPAPADVSNASAGAFLASWADSNGRLGVRAANNNAPIEVHVTVDASPELDARITHVSAHNIASAAPLIVRAAIEQTIRQTSRPSLMGNR